MGASWLQSLERRRAGCGSWASGTGSPAGAGSRRWGFAVAMALLVLLGSLVVPPPALAGTYHVLACDAAPRAANNSWRATESRRMTADTRCPSRGSAHRGIVVRNLVGAGTVVHRAGAAMTFRAPPGTTLRRIEARWAGRRVGREWSVGLMGAGGRILAGCRAGGATTCRLGGQLAKRLSGRTLVQLAARCAVRAGCSTAPLRRSGDRVRARVAMQAVAVEVADPTLPSLAGTSGDLFAGGWVRGTREVVLRATDNVGLRRTLLEVDGVQRAARNRRCDYTQRVPCRRAAVGSYTLDTRGLADGRHVAALAAIDAAGNVRRLERHVLVDNHAPARVEDVRVLGGSRQVRSTNSFDLRWTPPSGQAAPIVRAHYRLCRVGSNVCVAGMRWGQSGIDDLAVPARGDWSFRVWLEDAAGNQEHANASRPITLRFDDRLPTQLTAGIRTGGGTARHVTVAHRARPTVAGRLVDAKGAATKGAGIAVLARVDGQPRFRRIGTVVTNRYGSYSYRVQSGPSRELRLSYAGSDRHRPSDATAHVAVRARSTMRVTDRRVRNGDRVRFSGRLLGGWVPREGKLVQLEAFYRDRWRTFAVVRTGPRGAWRRSYRFGGSRGRITYPFRARIPRERSYPYAVGFSRVVRVTVTGR